MLCVLRVLYALVFAACVLCMCVVRVGGVGAYAAVANAWYVDVDMLL